MACHECNGNTEHFIRLRLQNTALFEQSEVCDRIRTHGEIDRAHDRHLRINRQRDVRLPCRLDIEVGAKLGQMLRHIGVQTLLQDAVRPVDSCRWKPLQALSKHRLNASEVFFRHLPDDRCDAIDRNFDLDRLDALCPRLKSHTDVRLLARLNGNGRNGVADEHLVEYLTDCRLIRRPALFIGRERFSLDEL